MQVIASGRPAVGSADRITILRTLLVGAILLAGATFLAYAIFGMGLLSTFMPEGRASTSQLALGALAWTFGLTAPAAFGVIGIVRVGSALEQALGRRTPPTPAVRVRHVVADNHAVAIKVRLPDGSRVIPEIVIGPFGAAVIEELPPAGAVLARGPRSWEMLMANGRTHMIDHPLERASRDADRVRVWLGGDDADHVVKVYAAVVGKDPTVQRTPSCASLTPDQIAPWLASLPTQRSFDDDRRERAIRMIRAAV